MAAVVVMAVVLALAVVGCGSATEQSGTPSAPSASASAATATAATATERALPSATSPAAIATDTPGASAPTSTATPSPAGATGISGVAMIGPTCPVERADSPCPDRPYEARITVWQGSTMVAETRSGADGRFTLLLPVGAYRIVGESGSTLPHGTETTVTVVAGELARVTLRFDSGIR